MKVEIVWLAPITTAPLLLQLTYLSHMLTQRQLQGPEENWTILPQQLSLAATCYSMLYSQTM